MESRSQRLRGKVALVTGAGSSGPGYGIGKATAILFAREGARVVLVDHDQARAEETLAEIRGEGGSACVCQADVTKASDCEQAVRTAMDQYGRLDILMNNVGILASGTVVDVKEADWDRVLDVNLKSMMLTARFAIPAMVQGGGGSIINMSSVEAMRAGTFATIIPYSASKGGILSLTTAMALHHGRDNVRVNAISPGFLYTPMVAPRVDERMRALRRESAPLGTEGTAWDVAWSALFLASDESRWITGVNLPVDGGLQGTTPLSTFQYMQAV